MRLESCETIDPRNGIARKWRIGNLSIEWYVERPPQSWLRFDANLAVSWYADQTEGGS